jgi:small subunit ribosomal protein S6
VDLLAERTREYEMVMILSPEATQDEVAATVEHVDGLISGGGGAVADHESWGLKRLAYEISDFNEGNYVLTKFSLDASGVADLNRALTASEDIVRFLVTRQDSPKPSKDAEEEGEPEESQVEAVASSETEASAEAAAPSEEAGAEQP